MSSGLAWVVLGLCVVVLGWGGFTALTQRPLSWAQLGAAGVLELVLLGQSAFGFVSLARGFDNGERATTVGYLIGIVVLLPVGALWALSERSRWAGVVLGVGAFAVGAMTLRLLDLFGVFGG